MATPFSLPDEFVQGFFKSGQSLWQSMLQNPMASPPEGTGTPLMTLQLGYLQQQFELWTHMMASMSGQTSEPVVTPERGDRRFNAPEWRDNLGFSLLKQSYLLHARLMGDLVEAAELDEPTKHRLRFYARQFIDSISPANFPTSNPEAMQLAFDTRGESLRAGFANLLQDMQKGRLSITDEAAFEVGKNVATSEGAVVFENDLFQLIQYLPLTAQVASRPLVIVPPCINKFYILDLQPENSFVRFANQQGLTVFVVSWRNPGPEQAQVTWDDYIESGALKAIDVALAI